MTGKRGSLFGAKPVVPEPPAPAVPEPRRVAAAGTREGKRMAAVYLAPEALKQLHLLTIEEDTTVQALLAEGLNRVFEARGKSRLA